MLHGLLSEGRDIASGKGDGVVVLHLILEVVLEVSFMSGLELFWGSLLEVHQCCVAKSFYIQGSELNFIKGS